MPSTLPTKACHNCRRRRHRCDRSLPGCRKCTLHGEECLGYGQLLRWTNSMASRGKLAGKTTLTGAPDLGIVAASHDTPKSSPTLLSHILIDPLLKDLTPQTRLYISHFNSSVCTDLVSFDNPESNPFRVMLPLIEKYGYLREILIATSAIHMAALRRVRGVVHGREFVDALTAKQRAIELLRTALKHSDASDRSVLLSAVVFFVNFDLIDTGMGEWKTHMDAAGSLIASLKEAGSEDDSSLGRLCDAIASDCLTYHILSSTINPIDNTTAGLFQQADVTSILRRNEAFNYQCNPPELLQILLSTSRLCRDIEASGSLAPHHAEQAAALMERAVSFDVTSWVHRIQNLSSADDVETRIAIAAAHQAAVRLYIALAVPEANAMCGGSTADELAEETILQLSSLPVNHALVKGTVWPTFCAGSQMQSKERREWCIRRLEHIWWVHPMSCPWGYIETAMRMLEAIWATKDREPDGGRHISWLHVLQRLPENCLIV